MKNGLTLGIRQIIRQGRAENRARLERGMPERPETHIPGRPKVRADCGQICRPCPYVGCRYNMFLDLTPTGGIIFNHKDIEPGEVDPEKSCALDIAAGEPLTCIQAAELLNLTNTRVDQIERQALSRFGATARIYELDPGPHELSQEPYDPAPATQGAHHAANSDHTLPALPQPADSTGGTLH